MENCKKFISYQSGISCISSMDGNIPTFMLYFSHLDKLRYSFCNPKCINNKDLYNPIFFKDYNIEELLNWLNK